MIIHHYIKFGDSSHWGSADIVVKSKVKSPPCQFWKLVVGNFCS